MKPPLWLGAESNSDTDAIWFGGSLWVVFSPLLSWGSDEVPKQSLHSRSSGGDSVIVEGVPAFQPQPRCPAPAVAAKAQLLPGTGPCRAEGGTHPWICPVAFGTYLFNFCPPQYLMRSFTVYALCGKVFNEVLSSAASFDTALLFQLEEVNSKGSLCTFCQLSPLLPFSLPGTEVPSWLTFNHIKALIQSMLCPLSLLSTFSSAAQSFLTKGKTGTWDSLGILCDTVGNGVFPFPPRQYCEMWAGLWLWLSTEFYGKTSDIPGFHSVWC